MPTYPPCYELNYIWIAFGYHGACWFGLHLLHSKLESQRDGQQNESKFLSFNLTGAIRPYILPSFYLNEAGGYKVWIFMKSISGTATILAERLLVGIFIKLENWVKKLSGSMMAKALCTDACMHMYT